MILTPELLRARLDRWDAQQERKTRPQTALFPCICGRVLVGQQAFTAHVFRNRKRARRHRLRVF